MNEFMDYWVVIAAAPIQHHCHGFAGCGLPKCRASNRQLLPRLTKAARFLFCEHSPLVRQIF